MTPHMKKLIASAFLSLAAAAMSAPAPLAGAAGRYFTAHGGAVAAPSALRFSSASYSVTEGTSAKIRVSRTGGTQNKVVGKVTLADVSTSPADYRFTPGARDASFNQGGSGANGDVSAVAVQPDGKMLVVGGFTSYNGDESAPNGVMRLNADGTRDTTFNPGGSGTNSSDLAEVALQPDGKIIIGGRFTSYNGDESAPDCIIRLNADGTRDTAFNPGGSGAGPVSAVAFQPDGKMLVVGGFTSYNGDESAPNGVMRLNADGTRDTTFNPGGSGTGNFVSAVAVLPDGKILVDGVLRLNADGTRDTTFNPGGRGANGFVGVSVVQPDGKIIIGGPFTAYNGDESAPDGVLRLNADGTRDMTFNPGGAGAGDSGTPRNSLSANADAVALQPDGKIIIGGFFRSYNGDGSVPDHLMRLNADGTRDTTFNPGGSGASVSPPGLNSFSFVNDVALLPDGKIIIGGRFNVYNGDASVPTNIMQLDGDLFVTWRDGDAAERFVLLPVVEDGIAEADETLTLSLSVVSGGASLGYPRSATLTIGGPGNPIDDGRNFVRQHYYDFLGREPDDSGLAFWTDQMTDCGSPDREVCRVNVSAAFFLSIEFQQTGFLVERMYKAAFGDANGVSTLGGSHQLAVPVVRFSEFVPDTQQIGRDVVVGVGGWERQLEANKQAFALAFVQRPEFLARYPVTVGTLEYVNRLDANAGGVLTDAERAALLGELSPNHFDPALRASVLRKVAEHPTLAAREFNRAFVLMQYFGYLRRDPAAAPDADHTGYDFWLRKLDGFGGDYIRAEMVRGFLNSAEYRDKFAQ